MNVDHSVASAQTVYVRTGRLERLQGVGWWGKNRRSMPVLV
jgi:hypothetical protein